MNQEIIKAALGIGIELAQNAMSHLSKEANETRREIIAASEQSKESANKLLLKQEESIELQVTIAQKTMEKLSLAAQVIESSIKNKTDKIIGKIEAERLEELISTINAANFCIECNNRPEMNSLATKLMQLNEYAQKRTAEGNFSWLSPWLIGHATWGLLIGVLGSDGNISTAIENRNKRFRVALLDIFGQQLLAKNLCDWDEIANFVAGTNASTLNKLPLLKATYESGANNSLLMGLASRPPDKSNSVPRGLKKCKKCGGVEFDIYVNCPKCGAEGNWWG
jgi:hypothetical protein